MAAIVNIIESEFTLSDELCYLNHAAVSPWPKRTVDAVKRFAEENGSSGSRYYDRWLETEQLLRRQLQTLIGASSSDEIALLKSTSEALSVVAYGLDWSAGDQVIISSQEFSFNKTFSINNVCIRRRINTNDLNTNSFIFESKDTACVQARAGSFDLLDAFNLF